MDLLRSQILLLTLIFSGVPFTYAEELPWIEVDKQQSGFVVSRKEDNNSEPRKFVPWGFNYDHDADGALLEDYWERDWERVAEDFREMKELGANVVRVHLQFGKFMDSAEKPNAKALERLAKLVKLAERTELYLDVTGLACYHKQDVPEWYDKLTEAERWQSQAVFWSAVSKTCAASPAIFCYDLMNEPVVPAGDKPGTNWLGPAFGDKHFVQYISLDRAGRPRPEIAQAWVHHLVTAIRRQDKRHLITVGLVPWSLDRPGLTSGFEPHAIVDDLDFISVHLYPESGKLAEDMKTLSGFAVGKPVVIEETFPLRCRPEELAEFFVASRKVTSGWIGFYWGQTLAEYRALDKPTIASAITLQWLELFQEQRKQFVPDE